HISTQPSHPSTVRKKSNVHFNDQMIKTATLKEHPYSSHISRFAMFPSFLSPDDPERGVRAASQTFLNPVIPNKAPDVTLLSKTIGGPYRHEILETPGKNREMAVSWTGQNGFLDGEKQIFYPAPPKTVLPNPQLRAWDLSLSERTSNMLRNLERKLWITSYQMDFTGMQPKRFSRNLDILHRFEHLRFSKALNDLVIQTERSYPVFVPSKPKGGRGRKQQSKLNESSYSPNSAGLQMPAANQSTASSYMNHQQPQVIMSNYNEAGVMTQMDHSQSESRTAFIDAQRTDPSLEFLQQQQARTESAVDHGREGENRKIRFNESLMHESKSKSSQDVAAQLSGTQQHFNLNNQPYSLKERKRKSMELQKDACILPRPHTLPGIPHTNASETVLGLQNSFSKSEAHQRFNSSITPAAVNLRDNVVTGKRHSFYGINCNHIHG
uniref:Uncharacterized protein n=1 Tax=Fundulus heteroclitus TaxID=8078 RepID=A0A3Q2QRK9_FUNHE